MVYRRKLDKPAKDSVAEHDQVSEVYHIISGSGTLVLGPEDHQPPTPPGDAAHCRGV
jgi:mannose-6-phosphate isomerase-like protein (cupin superfamily)